MKLKVVLLSTCFIFSANAYDVVERYKIIDDKFKTEAMMRPIGHDFFIDLSVAMNKNLTDVIDDVEKATKFQGTTAQKINEANRILTKYNKTEQTLKVNFGLGFPLPSFTAFEVGLVPNFRVLLDIGANIGIQTKALTNDDILNMFADQVPAALESYLRTLDLIGNAGSDVRTLCLAAMTPGSAAYIYCSSLPTGVYVIPNVGTQNPTLNIFGKADLKAGFFNTYTFSDHFFGEFNLYGLGRADHYQFITGTQVAGGVSIEAPDKMNTEVTAQVDYRLGYKNANYSTYLSVEELKLAKVSDRDAGSKAQRYENNALIRLHGEALFKLSALSLKPFAGVHKRSGYGFGDGVYVGADAGAYVWGDRLGLQMRGMFDKQYITLSPRIKIWLMQLEYSLKKPLKETDGDVRLTALHSLDFRLFF